MSRPMADTPKKRRPRRRFDDEFKEQAVRFVLDAGKTVGAVARDAKGQLAAATSTGGMTNKRWGRIGDAPVIGAGTYASAQCAVSATGWGEFYIRAAVAHDICARMAYRGDSVRAAAEEVVLKVVPALGGDGGVIALDASGRVAMPFNTEGMYRGTIDADGKVRTAVYRDGD